MKVFNFSFDKVQSFSKTDVAYQQEDPLLAPFYKYQPSIDMLAQVIKDKKSAPNYRSLLVDVLKEQYSKAGINHFDHIDQLIHPQTFTVTTAHQPSLLTGPLYVILKIASVINLARSLNQKVEEHIVPIFIIGGEDHDFEEINHLSLFGKNVEWQTNQSGSVGRMELDGFTEIIEQVKELLGNSEFGSDLISKMDLASKRAKSYGEFSFLFLQQIFAETELVILRMDHPKLKSAFSSIIHDEVFNQSSADLVRSTQENIEKVGFGVQAYVRDINFFYLTEGRRDRIELNETGGYEIVNTDIKFSKNEMAAEIESHPERFSPNVVIRPLFQELILPNLAYIGGGGELAYWLERKSQFEHYKINYPMLIRRNSILWVDKGSYSQWQNLDLEVGDLFKDEELLVTDWVKNQTSEELSIEEELQLIENAYQAIEQKAQSIDPTLVKAIAAEKTKTLKSTSQLGGRLIRSQKQKFEVSLNRLRKVKQKLFPNGGLQERSENFMSVYLRKGPEMISFLIENLNPLEKDFKVIVEE